MACPLALQEKQEEEMGLINFESNFVRVLSVYNGMKSCEKKSVYAWNNWKSQKSIYAEVEEGGDLEKNHELISESCAVCEA